MTDRIFRDTHSSNDSLSREIKIENALISHTPQRTLKNAYLEVEGVLSDLESLAIELSGSRTGRVVQRSVLRLQNVNVAINEAELGLDS